MPKYNRHQTVIQRNSDEAIDEDHWLKRFQNELIGKEAVQPKPVDSFLFDQINSIMNNKSKYPSVAAAVEDMKERSGLAAFLAKTSNNEENDNAKTAHEKKASDNNDAKKGKKLPTVILKCPNIRKTIENIVKSTRGNLSIPAIIDRVRSIHQGDVSEAKDWESDDLLYFVSGENLKAKQENPDQSFQSSNLGRRDDSDQDGCLDADNNDAFSALMPAKF